MKLIRACKFITTLCAGATLGMVIWGVTMAMGATGAPFVAQQVQGLSSPQELTGLSAWYDISDLSSLYVSANTHPTNGQAVKLISDKSGNSAVNAFVSEGAASNTATSPTKTVTGSHTFSFDVLFPDYTPGSNLTLVDKLSGNDGFQILLLTTGVIRLRIGDGSAVTNVDSTTGLTITDLTRGQFQAIWNDGVGATFTQNGSALGTAVAAAKTLTNAAVSITVATSTPGVIYSFTVDGVYNMNPSGAAKLAGTFTAPTTGETWTINTSGDLGARICGARDLYQGDSTKRPVLTIAAGANKLTFDGVNDYMKAASWSMVQPETVYFVGSQVSWTSPDDIYDGGSASSMVLGQRGSTPALTIYAGNVDTASISGLALQTNGVITSVFNSASSQNRLNRGTAATGDAGNRLANGFTLAAIATGGGNFANITASEILIYAAANSISTQDAVIGYLARKWSISGGFAYAAPVIPFQDPGPADRWREPELLAA